MNYNPSNSKKKHLIHNIVSLHCVTLICLLLFVILQIKNKAVSDSIITKKFPVNDHLEMQLINGLVIAVTAETTTTAIWRRCNATDGNIKNIPYDDLILHTKNDNREINISTLNCNNLSVLFLDEKIAVLDTTILLEDTSIKIEVKLASKYSEAIKFHELEP
jgi:hypothetical protein